MIQNTLLLGASLPSTLLNGLAGYWKLDGNGNDVLGVSNGTLQGVGMSWVAGKVGQALNFGVGAGRLNVGGASQIKPTSALTVGGWFRFSSVPAANSRVSSDWHQDGAKDRWILGYFPSSDCFFHIGSNCLLGNVGTTIPLDTWVHLVGTASEIVFGAYAMTTYRNGAVVATATGSTLFRSGAGNVCIGQQEESGGAMTGDIDEYGMWNRALTGGEVSDWYNAGVGKTHPFN